MAAARRFDWRSMVKRGACALLVAVFLQYAAAWACAAAAAWAGPTWQSRAPWIASRTQVRTVLGVASEVSNFTLFETRGVLAHSIALQWAVRSFNVEEGPALHDAAAGAALQIPELLDWRDRAAFRSWLDGLRPVPGAPMAILEENAFGFPLHGLGFSMRTDYTVETRGGTRHNDPVFRIAGGVDAGALSGSRTPRPALVLPLVARWPEFLVNTAFWCLVVLACHPGARMVRRGFRRRRGRCPGCGYDRRGLAGESACPECGM